MITQAENDELRNILEKEMSELHEKERKLDDGNKKSTFWGTLWKVAEKVKEGFFEKMSKYLDSSDRISFIY